MSLETLNTVISVIALFVGMFNIIKKARKWDVLYSKHDVNQKQVATNIEKGRRADWGTGREENWRHAWNENNVEYHKITDYIKLFLESVFYMIATWIILLILCAGLIAQFNIPI